MSWLKQQSFDLGLKEFLSHEVLEGGIVFVSSPRAWRSAKISGGMLQFAPGAAVNTDEIFAIEGFHPDSHVNSVVNYRWTVVNHVGRGVIISHNLAETEGSIKVHDEIESGYYLWGTVAETRSDGWTKLRESRIGSIWIPLENVPLRSYVQLRKIELLTYQNDGVVTVIDELLLGFKFANQGSEEPH
jgi:CRISPR-associated protein (TIGR03984 family)